MTDLRAEAARRDGELRDRAARQRRATALHAQVSTHPFVSKPVVDELWSQALKMGDFDHAEAVLRAMGEMQPMPRDRLRNAPQGPDRIAALESVAKDVPVLAEHLRRWAEHVAPIEAVNEAERKRREAEYAATYPGTIVQRIEAAGIALAVDSKGHVTATGGMPSERDVAELREWRDGVTAFLREREAHDKAAREPRVIL